MNKQMSLSAFTDELAQVRTKKKEFLEQINRIIPWGEWITLIQPCYYKGERGNKPYDLELMLRIYMLQNLYDLSDEGTVAEVIDSRAFSDFCRVDSSNQVPNGDTLGRFRNLLIQNGLQDQLFTQVVVMLMERGLILKKGTINENEKFSTANHSLGQHPLNSCELCGVAIGFCAKKFPRPCWRPGKSILPGRQKANERNDEIPLYSGVRDEGGIYIVVIAVLVGFRSGEDILCLKADDLDGGIGKIGFHIRSLLSRSLLRSMPQPLGCTSRAR